MINNGVCRLAQEIHPMRVYMSCTTTFRVGVKTEHVCHARQSLHALHCALLQVSAFHSVVSCLKWVFHDLYSDSFCKELTAPPSVLHFKFSSFWINALIASIKWITVVSGPWSFKLKIFRRSNMSTRSVICCRKQLLLNLSSIFLPSLMNNCCSSFSSHSRATTTLPLENQGTFV